MNEAANRLLRSREITQVRLEEVTGVDQSLISRYFNDHIVPKMPNARKLALALGISLDQLYDVIEGRWPVSIVDLPVVPDTDPDEPGNESDAPSPAVDRREDDEDPNEAPLVAVAGAR